MYHRSIAQNDIRLAAKLVALYDFKTKLFCDPEASFGNLLKIYLTYKNIIIYILSVTH